MGITITKDRENQYNAEDEVDTLSLECKELLSSLPKERGWKGPNLYLFQGFWFPPEVIQPIVSIQKHYTAQDTDIIVATVPKSGTTWLKALTFAIVNRQYYAHNQNNHPLLTSNSHQLVPFLESESFRNNNIPDMSRLPRSRLVGTHMPISALPNSVRDSNCKIVYIVRNPFDTFVSLWLFLSKLRPQSLGPLMFDEAFDMYCRGVVGFGPYWEHMLGYWHESLRSPDKVLFLKYEEMNENTSFQLKKIADFLGFSFSFEEEEDGVVEGIAKLCSFEHIKKLEVNKVGKPGIAGVENKLLFRKGEVGDWVNHFTPMMVERLSNIMDEKLAGTGLSFKI